ncbi:MAG: efflux RND transporter permease subunit [Coriobacteriia bacterium]|nr:efflux RND transporter permease subunit [Coriobacteriia bacterium]
MLSRFSVKRPYVIIVAVIVALILGGVSLSKMKTDLLPEMDMPYLAVITTQPGATAEKVEQEVTKPLEDQLATVNGVDSTSSISSDNFSMVFLQFQDGTNMDSALVKVSSAANEVAGKLPEGAGTPNFLEINADMMATMYVTASFDDKDIYQATEFVKDNVIPALERVNGVADVSPTGLVEKSVEVRLNDDKIEQINNKILASVNSQLYDAKKKIDDGKKALDKAEKKLEQGEKDLEKQQKETNDKLSDANTQLTQGISQLESQKAVLNGQISTAEAQAQAYETQLEGLRAQLEAATDPMVQAQLQMQIEALEKQSAAATAQVDALKKQLAPILKKLEDSEKKLGKTYTQTTNGALTAAAGFGSAAAQISSGKETIKNQRQSLKDAEKQYKDARKAAIKSANIDKLVEKNTLAQVIKAQDFSMPAGYVKSGSSSQWLLRVGDRIESVDELKGLMLADIDDVGKIHLKDVADVVTIDNAGFAYMKQDGQDAILLSLFKGSTASTSDVSTAVNECITDLTEQYPGMHLNAISDQGKVIFMYIKTILTSLLLGILLAIIVLALFLRDWKPTIIVAFSIPFSVLVALLVMYFTGIGINIMTLGGLSMAIGMLVDNSIVMLENIYRLRGRGISAARAAAQGAKQMTGAVVASTLTTVCVFLPIMFTTGLVNQMLAPFALTIAYVLTASLVVALTLVPAVSSFVFKNYVPKRSNWFEKLKDLYGRSLQFFLRHKVLPLGVSLVLLIGSVWGVVNMGVTLIPDMTSSTIDVSVKMPDDTKKKDAFKMADEVMEAAMGIEGVKLVAAMDGTATVSALNTDAGSSYDEELVQMISFNLLIDDTVDTEDKVRKIRQDVAEATKDMNCEVTTDSTESMSSMMGSGLSIKLKGPDKEKLQDLSEEVMEVVKSVDGYTEVDNGSEEAANELHLVIDRTKLMEAGYTVAQLYSDLAQRLTTDADATSLTIEGTDLDVKVVDKTDPITRKNLLDTKIEIDKTTADGTETKTYKLGDFATVKKDKVSENIAHSNGMRTMTVTAEVLDGFNNALLSRDLKEKLDAMDLEEGYSVTLSGEIDNIDTMLSQMLLMLLLGFVLIYLVMVAQFQNLLSPFIILFTVPLAFTGGFLGLAATGEQLNMLSLMGFAVLMGTVVNNGIVFVDYVNQLRIGGLERREALVAAGRTRMRPILMTALTTILAMMPMVLSQAVGSSMQRGMAVVVVGGLLYATLMTLYVVPCIYDILFKRQPYDVDLGDESLDDDPGDAQAYLDELKAKREALPQAEPESADAFPAAQTVNPVLPAR